jgi:hypothetical protein
MTAEIRALWVIMASLKNAQLDLLINDLDDKV